MTVLLALLCGLLFSWPGVVLGVLAGLLLDEVLWALLLVPAARAFLKGRPWRFFPGLPGLALAETALVYEADRNHDSSLFVRYGLVKDWLHSGAGSAGARRFLGQLPRIWAAIDQAALQLDLVHLTGVLAQQAGLERRIDFMEVLAAACAADPEGTDLHDLEFLSRTAVALDIPVLGFHQILNRQFSLDREASLCLGLPPQAARQDLMEAGKRLPAPDSAGLGSQLAWEAFRAAENRFDARERVLELYRERTLRESR